MNTHIQITFHDGETREFTVSDQLEVLIRQGEMFSVVSIHPEQGEVMEASVSKVFAGNPIAALGNMLLYRKAIKQEGFPALAIQQVDHCITLLSDEITSHRSNVTPTEKH